jgi:chitinase
MNFANQCYAGGFWTDPQGHQTNIFADCTSMIPSIQYCHSRGKKVVLSIGGDSPVYFNDDATATNFAAFIWGAVGPNNATWTGPRPFGDVVLDGIDFDIETPQSSLPAGVYTYTGIAAAAQAFRTIWATQGVQRLLTAAPQCVVPDSRMQYALAQVSFDAVFIQFYNTPACSATAYFDGSGTFSYDQWISWLQANSANPGIQAYIGLPAAPAAASPGYYLTAAEAQTLACLYGNKYPTMFGGVMLYEMTYSANNVNAQGQSYAQQIKAGFGMCAPPMSTTTVMIAPTTTAATITTRFGGDATLIAASTTSTALFVQPTLISTSGGPIIATTSTSFTGMSGVSVGPLSASTTANTVSMAPLESTNPSASSTMKAPGKGCRAGRRKLRRAS